MSDKNEIRRIILEMDGLKMKLEAKLKDAGKYYDKLKDAYDAAVNDFTEIEPKLDKSKRDADICRVTGNSSFVIGGILAGIGLLASPLTAGASLALTVAGGGLIGAGGVVTVGATIGNSIVKNMNYSEAKELLVTFQRYKTRLCEEFDHVYDVSKTINEKRNLDKYQPIFEIMFPENSIQYKILNVYYKNPDLITKFDILQSLDGATNIAKSVCLFANVVEELSVEGAKVTKSAVTKILIPIGVVIDTAFLIASIIELSEGKKCNVAEMVGLMKETIEKEMQDINDIRSKLYFFSLEEKMKY